MSNAAATGALIGLVVGGFHYVVTLAVIGMVAAPKAGEETPGLEAVARRLQSIKLALLGTCFLVLPLVGYATGAMLSHGEAR